MAGMIPRSFINDLMARVDIVDVIDRRVPLTRKGKEYIACCPFHEEKTPSFTVSSSKQFYHCFGCGANGTAIGFLMNYANLGFVEAVEDLANGLGMELPAPDSSGSSASRKEGLDQRLQVVKQASDWFQAQLRTHAEAGQAVDYLKSRGLDGKVAADFRIGYAPDSWTGLVDALGTSPELLKQLVKIGLITGGKDDSEARYYDRFRGRIMFPIEDHRGRPVGFGGRILGDGEPKYLNSPETPLFHKGAELYGLHRARREVGKQNKSIVVEGYMDVVSLAQFGVDNVVATLGTATTRTHLQRLFRLAPEIVFCFDGDRAGRAAAWKAMEVSLLEMQDGRRVGFLFLQEGEDPDTTVRAEGAEMFVKRVDDALPLSDFLFDSLTSQVDMSRLDGKATLVSLALPLIDRLPAGALREGVHDQLSLLSGLPRSQFADSAAMVRARSSGTGRRSQSRQVEVGQLSPLALAVSLLLQNPELAQSIEDPAALKQLRLRGADILTEIVDLCRNQSELTTAGLLECFRETPSHAYLGELAMRPNLIDDGVLERQLKDTLSHLLESQNDLRRRQLLEQARQSELTPEETEELNQLLKTRVKNG